MFRLLTVASLVLSSAAFAATDEKPLSFAIDQTTFAGTLIYDKDQPAPRAMLLVPNWMGINEANLNQAREIARRGYTVYVVDMYGETVRPDSMQAAGQASGAVKGDTEAMRQRINAALQTLLNQPHAPVKLESTGAIGFCFGGTVVLELARSGAKLPAVVSFHGGLGTGAKASAPLSAKVLVLHGADDPYVPKPEVDAFEVEMREAKADWQLVSFGGAVHSFTDVGANMKGQAEYNEVVARRAYGMMDNFFAETLK
jgi:dienelactone hydrolase